MHKKQLTENLLNMFSQVPDATLSAVIPDQLVQPVVRDRYVALLDAQTGYFGNLKKLIYDFEHSEQCDQ